MTRTLAITQRVYWQLLKDRRFLALSIVAPLLIIYFLKVTLDALSPTGDASLINGYVMPVVATITFFLAYLLCSLSLVRERTRETLTRMFVNGFRRNEIVAGYLLGFAGLATLQALLALIEANLIFGLSYSTGKQVSLFLVIWLLAIISVELCPQRGAGATLHPAGPAPLHLPLWHSDAGRRQPPGLGAGD